MNPLKPNTELTRAILIYSPPQQQQYYRPFNSHLDGDSVSAFMASTKDGSVITPASLAPIASQIISPSTTPEGVVNIANGFQNARYAFFMELTTTSNFGVSREIISGFTDTTGVSESTGAMDPHMRFFVNSRMVINESRMTNAVGTQAQFGIRENYNVISKIDAAPNAVVMRPEDAVSYQRYRDLSGGSNEVIDMSTTLNGIAKQANKTHNIPSSYLNDICHGYKNAMAINNVEMSQDALDLYNATLGEVRVPSVGMSEFMSELGSHIPTNSYTFTYSELSRLWPRPNDFWTKVLPKAASRLVSPLEHTEAWTGANIETQIAYSLTHTLPAIMGKLMLMELELTMTNMTVGNEIFIQPLNWSEMFEGVLNKSTLDYLCTTLSTEVVRGVLYPRGVAVFDIHMKINLLSNSYFTISIDGRTAIPYAAPMFCDSFYSPLIGLNGMDDNGSLARIGNNMDQLANHCFSRTQYNPFENLEDTNPVLFLPAPKRLETPTASTMSSIAKAGTHIPTRGRNV